MLSQSLIFLLLSNAVTFRRDRAITHSRVLIYMILYSIVLILSAPIFIKAAGLYAGLLHITSLTLIFHFFFVNAMFYYNVFNILLS